MHRIEISTTYGELHVGDGIWAGDLVLRVTALGMADNDNDRTIVVRYPNGHREAKVKARTALVLRTSR